MAQGRKTGGRQRGTPNKATTSRQREVAESGLTPLQFLLDAMRDDDREFAVRLEAAKAAAPFVHPKLANVSSEVSGPNGGAIVTAVEWRIVDPSPGDA